MTLFPISTASYRIPFYIVLGFLSVGNLARPCSADPTFYKEGLVHLKKQEYSEAAALFLKEAQTSLDPKSMHELILLVLANRIEKDPLSKDLAELCSKAIGIRLPEGETEERFPHLKPQKPQPLAHANMGLIFENGMGVPESLEESTALYKMAGSGGDPFALKRLEKLGKNYYYGNGVKQDFTEALDYLSIPASHNSPSAMALTGLVLYAKAEYEEDKKKRNEDLNKSSYWLEKTLKLKKDLKEKQGARVYRTLGLIYGDQTYPGNNFQHSIRYHQTAAEKGETESAQFVGLFYEGAYLFDKAKKYFKMGADEDDPICQYRLARLLPNPNERDLLYLQAAKLGYPPALVAAGEIYYNALVKSKAQTPGTIADQAFEFFKEASDADYAPAQYHLGKLYEHPGFGKMNKEVALDYYEQALANGITEAEKDVLRLKLELSFFQPETCRPENAIVLDSVISGMLAQADHILAKADLKNEKDLSALDQSLRAVYDNINNARQTIELQAENLEKADPSKDYADFIRATEENENLLNELNFKKFEASILTKSGWGKQLDHNAKEIDHLISVIETAERTRGQYLNKKTEGSRYFAVWQERFKFLSDVKNNLIQKKNVINTRKQLFEIHQRAVMSLKQDLANKVKEESRKIASSQQIDSADHSTSLSLNTGYSQENLNQEDQSASTSPQNILVSNDQNLPTAPKKKKKKRKNALQRQAQITHPAEERKEDPSQKQVSVNITSKDDVINMLNKMKSNNGQTPLAKKAVLDLREHFEKNGHQVPEELTDPRFKNRGPLVWPAQHVHINGPDHVLFYYYYVLDGVSHIKFVGVENHPSDDYKQWNELAARFGASLRREYPRARFPK